MTDPSTDHFTLSLTAQAWAFLDSTADNDMSDNAIDGDPQVVLIGGAIRQAGWDQVPWVNGQWPAMTDIIAITLTVAQWEFLARSVEAAEAIDEELGYKDAVALGQATVQSIRSQLVALQGPSGTA